MKKAIATAVLSTALVVGASMPAHAAPATPPPPSTSFDVLVGAVADRLSVADAVAQSKLATGAAVDDPAREAVVLTNAADAGSALGVPATRTRAVFADQIVASKTVQRALIGLWTAVPALAPTGTPDLVAARADIDKYSTIIVTELAATSALASSPSCPAALVSSTVRVIGDRRLDPLHVAALLQAERSICPFPGS